MRAYSRLRAIGLIYKEICPNHQKNAEALNTLIQEIIEFRKLETGNRALTIQRINIGELCQDSISSYTSIIEENEIKLECQVDTELCWNTDKKCFLKIFNNLFSNAIKYTPIGGTIRITLQKKDSQLYLSVFNSGKGIKREQIPLIFNRYSILDNISDNHFGKYSSRHGLGLAICYSMVKHLNGEITIDSEEGQYATFSVILPMAQINTNAEVVDICEETVKETYGQKKHTRKNVTIQPDNQQSTVLVIDDNEEILMMIEDALSSQYQIITAYNSDEGFQLIKERMPDIIITDIMMPGIDGIELTKILKADKHTMHIPIIIISARNSNDDKIDGLASGADAYIEKPFSLEYLKAITHRLLVNKEQLRNYYNTAACNYDFYKGAIMKKEDREMLQKFTEIIDANLSRSDLSIEEIAELLGLSVRNLYRKFKEMDQHPPKDFIKDYRIQMAAKYLKSTTMTTQEIMYRCGFNSRSHFYKEFDKRFHMTPKEYRSDTSQYSR